MDDDLIAGLIDAIVEDYTWDELMNLPRMLCQLEELLDLPEHQLLGLLYGAVCSKALRKHQPLSWQGFNNIH